MKKLFLRYYLHASTALLCVTLVTFITWIFETSPKNNLLVYIGGSSFFLSIAISSAGEEVRRNG
jgi:hypothetical protein